MPAPILAKCPCGRTLRAREDQIGATVRCWDCGGEVPVSPPAERSYIGEPMFRALRDSVRAPAVGLAAAGAGVLTLALFVPGAGGWVALAAAASLVAWWYGGLVRRAGLGDRKSVV